MSRGTATGLGLGPFWSVRARVALLLLSLIAALAVALLLLWHVHRRSVALFVHNKERECSVLLDDVVDVTGASLDRFARDYTLWDEMIRCVETGDRAWAEENFVPALDTFDADAVWLLRTDYSLVYSANRLDEDALDELPVPPSALPGLFARTAFRQFSVSTPRGPLEIRTAPVQPTGDAARATPARGYLLAGRLWPGPRIDEIAGLVRGAADLVPAPATASPASAVDEAEGTVRLARTLSAWDGKAVAELRVRIASPIVGEVGLYSNLALLIELGFALLVLAASYVFLTRWVTRPLSLIRRSLRDDDPGVLRDLQSQAHELGLVAQLVAASAEQKKALGREVAARTAAERELQQAKDALEDRVRERTAEVVKAKEALESEVARRKRAQAELSEAHEGLKKVDRMKTEFMSMMSHELRTPLAAIGGFVDLIDQEVFGPVSKEQREGLERIRTQTEHLEGLIQSILDFSRIEFGQNLELQREPVSLARLIARTAGSVGESFRKKEIDLRLNVPDDLPAIVGDEAKLRRVLANLLDNALKFTPRGGSVAVDAAARDDEIVVSVTDTGIGIPTDLLEKVFEKFFQVDASATRQYGGIGMGLTIAREIAGAHGGRIWAESKGPGRGARVAFALPLR
jgi:signal transduction histidine kinase/sensor domain CHASE-containing protein